MASGVSIPITLVDKISSDLDHIRNKFDAFGKASTQVKFGMALGAGKMAFDIFSNAVGGATDALRASVQAALDDEASQSKLRAALVANVKGWDGNTDAIEKAIAARMKLGFSDDEQRDSLAVLVARTGNYTEALDISRVAMDFARLKGIGLAEASKAIALGMGGQGRALKELGINVKELTNKQEVLGAIQGKAAGQAEAWGQTTAGAMQTAQVAMEEASEAIGQKLLPVLKNLALFVTDNVIPATDALTQEWVILPYIIDPIGTAMGNAKKSMSDMEAEAKRLADEESASTPIHTAYAERVDAIGAATAEAAQDIGTIIQPSTLVRKELARLSKSFVDAARTARANRLDEAYDVAELPLQVAIAGDEIRTIEAKLTKDLTAAERKKWLQVKATHAVGSKEYKEAEKHLAGDLTAAERRETELALLEAKRKQDQLVLVLKNHEKDYKLWGKRLGTDYGRALFNAVHAWNSYTISDIHRLDNLNPLTGKGWGGGERRHAGGPVMAGQPYIIGKPGAEELFVPRQSGTVIPPGVTSSPAPAFGGGSSVTVNVAYSPGLSTASPAEMDTAARVLGPAIVRELRSRGLIAAGSY